MKKRFLAMVLVVLMVLSIIPTSVFANMIDYDPVTLNDIITIDDQWDGSLETTIVNMGSEAEYVQELYITMPGVTLTSADITYINSMANLEILEVSTDVSVPDGVVGNYFLSDNDNLHSVVFPAATFGAYAFAGCNNLITLSLPNATTFDSCLLDGADGLTSVSMPNATTFGTNAFNNVTNLLSISLPSAVTFGNNPFLGCTSLITASMPNATTFGYNAFYQCPLTDISLPSAENFGSCAFYSSNIVNVSLPSVTTFGDGAFRYSDDITSISLPSATTFGTNAFGSCDGLTSVSLPSVTTIGSGMFSECTQAIEMTLTSNPPTVTDGFASYDAEAYGSSIVVPEDQEVNYDEADLISDDGMWYGWGINPDIVTFDSNGGSAVSSQSINYNGHIVSEPADPTKTGYTFDGWYSDVGLTTAWNFASDNVTGDMTLYAKWGCGLTYDGNGADGGSVPAAITTYDENEEVTILANLNTLLKQYHTFSGWNTAADYSGDYYAFDSLLQILQNTTLYAQWEIDNTGNTYEDGLVTITGDFGSGMLEEICTGLGVTDTTTITGLRITSLFGALNADDIAYINSMTSLTTLDVASHINCGNAGDYFMDDNDALYSVNFPATSFGSYAFAECDNLASVSLPNATIFGSTAFYHSVSLTTVSLPSAINFGTNPFMNCISLESISLPLAENFGNNPFSGCTSLATVALPNALTFGYNAFSYSNLTSVSLPNATTFGSGAFYNSSNLTTIDLPSATTFGERAFRNCDSLESVSLTSPSFVCGDYMFAYDTTTVILTLGDTPPAADIFSFAEYNVETYHSFIVVPGLQTLTYDEADGLIDGRWYGWDIDTDIVTFDSVGGTAVDKQYLTYNVDYATEPTAPTKEGYAFAGWYKDAEYSEAWDFATDMVISSVTLYAKWEELYNVTYDANGANGGDVPTDERDYTNGETVTVMGNTGFLYKSHYTFEGWCTEPGGLGSFGDFYAEDDTFEIDSDTTLYALWVADNYYVTYLEGEHGSFQYEESPSEEIVAYLSNPDQVPTVIADEGYEFLYWQVNPVYGGLTLLKRDEPSPVYMTTAEIEAMEVTENISFTAIYGELDEYTVTFDSDGGSAVASQTVYDGNKVTKPSNPTKEGYTFSGWWYDGSEASGAWDFNVNTVNEDITLYATWTKKATPSPTQGTTQKGNITLTLKDSNGNPLAYYPVELHSVVISGITDANGQVTFSNVTLENHELVVFDKKGSELGTINLTMSEADTNSTSVNGTDVAISFNESAVSIDIEIAVADDGGLLVDDIEINANPKTGTTETALYIGEGSEQVNILPYLSIVLTALLIGSVFLVIRKQFKKE
jgi:uncharacterized repeat protein (TIGR02543 family)